MAIKQSLQGTKIGLDTAPLIYFIEKHPIYHPLVRPFFQAAAASDIQIVTSTITLLEVLVHPLKKGDVVVAASYRRILLNSPNFLILPLTVELSERAATLRAKYNLRTPDAVQIATALETNAAAFLTNDKGLKRITELDVLLPNELI